MNLQGLRLTSQNLKSHRVLPMFVVCRDCPLWKCKEEDVGYKCIVYSKAENGQGRLVGLEAYDNEAFERIG